MTQTQIISMLQNRMVKHRFDPNNPETGWNIKYMNGHPSRVFISKLIDAGYRVRSGYYATSVRGFHHYVILYRKRK